MRVAVLSLTRDRLEYTQHCFESLEELAGCEYDHYVLDQGSTDGTDQWLMEQPLKHVSLLRENVGISRGMNKLLGLASGYDVIVKFDNDCELLQPDTLRICAELALSGDAILSPCIEGLNRPPGATGEFHIGDERVLDIPQIGGIFMAAPAKMFCEYRFTESNPIWGQDDAELCWWYRGQGGRCGYVSSLTANHYETTSGQHSRYPDYFQRTLAEGKPSL